MKFSPGFSLQSLKISGKWLSWEYKKWTFLTSLSFICNQYTLCGGLVERILNIPQNPVHYVLKRVSRFFLLPPSLLFLKRKDRITVFECRIQQNVPLQTSTVFRMWIHIFEVFPSLDSYLINGFKRPNIAWWDGNKTGTMEIVFWSELSVSFQWKSSIPRA